MAVAYAGCNGYPKCRSDFRQELHFGHSHSRRKRCEVSRASIFCGKLDLNV